MEGVTSVAAISQIRMMFNAIGVGLAGGGSILIARTFGAGEFEKGNRQDLIDQANKEIEILNVYMPEQLSDEEVNKIIDITRPYARVVYERIYGKGTKDIWGNDKFKDIVDQIFDKTIEKAFDDVKGYTDVWLYLTRNAGIPIDSIKVCIDDSNSYFDRVLSSRKDNKSFNNPAIIIVEHSICQAFAEKFTEYIGY